MPNELWSIWTYFLLVGSRYLLHFDFFGNQKKKEKKNTPKKKKRKEKKTKQKQTKMAKVGEMPQKDYLACCLIT